MKALLKVILVLTIGLFVVIDAVSYLYAQEGDFDEFTLEEITVTAQKREENQQKVPIAMEVVSAEDIKELGKNNIDEIISHVSSAIIQKASDGYRVSIRGISDSSEARSGLSSAVPSVAINTDGVYSARKDNAAALYDIERVEVLIGPQSTMYSSNSPGGIVNIITALPKIDTYEVSGTLEYGSYNLIHTEGVMNAPLSDKAAIRAAFTTSVRDGYLDNGSDDEDTKSARLRALLQPNDKLSFTISGELTKNQSGGFGGGVVEFVNQNDVDNPWTGAESDPPKGTDETGKKVYGQMNLEMDFVSLSLTPSYFTRGGTSDITSRGETMHRDTTYRERSVELRMTSPSDFLFKWIAGFTYYHFNDNSSNESDLFLETGDGNYNYLDLENENKAVFFNITYPVMENFRLTAGYRSSWDDYLSHNIETRGPDYEIYDTWWALSTDGLSDYKVGFEYDWGEDSMLYADYATSYRMKGMGKTDLLQGEKVALGAYPPEYLTAYSIGSKNRFFGNKLQINASAYYYDYENYEAGGEAAATVWFEDTNDNQQMDPGEFGTDPWSGSLGDGTMYGFDLQTSAIITSKDMLNLSVSYEKSEWEDLYFHYYYPTTEKLIDGEVVTVPMEDLDYSGKPMVNTPPWTITMNYNHNFNLLNGGIIKVSINSKYRTSYRLSWNDEDYPMNYQEDYHMEDVSAIYTNPDGKWALSAYVKNIFNYAEKRMHRGSPAGAGTMSIGDPRTYGTVLSVRY